MIPLFDWISWTRVLGLVSYTVPILMCAFGLSRRRRVGTKGRILAVVAGVQLALLLDMTFNWRWLLHEVWMQEAAAFHVYEFRRTPQLISLVVLVGLVSGSVGLAIYRLRRRPGVALAVAGTVCSIGVWCAETLSYHFLDAVLYRMVGSVMAVAFVWLGLSSVTGLGLWIENEGGS